jgi:hypothetical protein
MSTPAPWTHALALAAAAAAAALLLPPLLAPALGLDPASLRGLAATLEGLERQRRDLEEEGRAHEARVAVHRRVGRALASGELTLAEAAARLGELHRADRRFCWDGFRDAYPGGDDGERHARNAAGLAVMVAREELGEAEAERLEARLERALGRAARGSAGPRDVARAGD